jgi:hypothetical protein
MSPEKSKNQFAILFQQYQTQQAEEELSPTDPQDLVEEARNPKPAKRGSKTVKTSKVKPQAELPEIETLEIKALEIEALEIEALEIETPEAEVLDEELDQSNLEVIRATRTLPPRRPRKQERPQNPKLQKLLEEEALKETEEQSGPKKRGRPANGKRSDPNWSARTFYIRKTTDEKVERVLDQMKRYNINLDKSELIDLLLEAWSMVESGEIDDFQIGEILQVDPPKLK